jgi:hypothetical protein
VDALKGLKVAGGRHRSLPQDGLYTLCTWSHLGYVPPGKRLW